MARIFSWKVSPTKYAYLIKDSMFGTEESCVRSRITDVGQLRQMADICNDLTESQYRDKYEIVKAEVNGTAGLWNMVNDYQEYYEASTAGYSDVVILSGVGMEGESDGLWQGGDEDEKWRELEEYIDKLMEEYRSQISADTAAIREAIAAAASADIGDAMNDLHQASERLDEIEQNLANAARDAQNALDAARSLIGLGADGITPEAIANVIQSTNRYDEWLNQNGSATTQMIVDYDALRSRMGGIGQAVDAAGGYLSYLGYSMNLLSGTVGTTERTMAALSGTILDQATWYDEAMSSMTQMGERIDAQQGIITQYGSYMEGLSGGMVNYVNQTIDAKNASITNEIYHRLSGTNENLTTIRNEMNAMSGYVKTEMSRINGSLSSVTGNITTINTNMDVMNGRLATAMTIATSALTQAIDMRETWSRESGMLRTVADLVIRTDDYGDPIFYYVGASGLGKTRVWKMEGLKNGLPYYNTKKDGSGIEYVEDVIPDYLTQMMSYVQQTVSSITFNVSSGDVIAALRLEVTHEGQAIIYGLADEIRLDAKVIANSLSAKTANIGGIEIGRGEIKYYNTNGSQFYYLHSNGLLEARNALIHGSISADTGYFKGALCAATGTFKGALQAATGTFNGGITASSLTLGSGAYGDLNTWINGKGYQTASNVQGLIGSSSGWIVTNAKNGMVELGVTYPNGGITSNSSVTISSDGLLVARNAIVSGTVYATHGFFNGTVNADAGYFRGSVSASSGYFKGAVSATQGTFTGEIHATSLSVGNQSITEFVNSLIPADGVTTGTVQNMINNSSGWVVTQAQNGVVKINTNYGGTASSFTLSNNGLLVAKNAIVSGSVFATNGVFNGDIYARNGVFQGKVSAATIYASDIVLDGNVLKLSSSANTFEISEEEIEVQEVPEDVTIQQGTYNYSSFNSTTSGGCAAMFTAMGDSTTIIPPHYIQATASKAMDYQQSIVGTVELVCAVFSADSQNTYAYSFLNQQKYPDLSRAISYGSNIQNFSMTSVETYQDVTVNASFDEAGGTSAELHLPCKDGVDYIVVFAWIQNGFQTQYLQQFTINFPKFSFVNAPNPTDTQFFNIGSNGMQIFLGNGFYFTAARDRAQGPIIAMGGQNMSGQMFGLRLTRTNGIQILTGKAGEGWHTPS